VAYKLQQILVYRYELGTALAFVLAILWGWVRSFRKRKQATEELKRVIRYYEKNESR
jgi:hypothetical protein